MLMCPWEYYFVLFKSVHRPPKTGSQSVTLWSDPVPSKASKGENVIRCIKAIAIPNFLGGEAATLNWNQIYTETEVVFSGLGDLGLTVGPSDRRHLGLRW